MNEVLVNGAAAIAVFMLSFWLASIPLRNVSIVDIGWGLGFVLVSWTGWLSIHWDSPQDGRHLTHLLLPGLVTVWGLRLSIHLARRNIGKPEDYRYAAMRQKRGRAFVWSSLLIVFGLQGVIMWIVALPLMAAAANAGGGISAPGVIPGLLVWATGFFFEAVGDWQLARFKQDPANDGRVMDRGLWRYTRHPNYFGDCCVWWGYWLISLAVSDGQHDWWTVISPILMTVLLLKVSGVALLEQSMKKRSPEYEAYIRRTRAFVPGPPRE